RGVHVDEVELVVHIDPPSEHKAYLHRSGRTARAGNAGDVVTLVLPEQRGDTRALLRRAGIHVTPQHVSADSAAVHALVGELARSQRTARQATPARPSRPRRPGAAGHRRRRRGAPSPVTGDATSTKSTESPRSHAGAPRTEPRRRSSRPQRTTR